MLDTNKIENANQEERQLIVSKEESEKIVLSLLENNKKGLGKEELVKQATIIQDRVIDGLVIAACWELFKRGDLGVTGTSEDGNIQWKYKKKDEEGVS